MSKAYDRAMEFLSAADRALGGPDDEPRRHRYITARRWWCATHDVIQTPVNDLERPRCPECDAWMGPYDEVKDNPTRSDRPNWSLG